MKYEYFNGRTILISLTILGEIHIVTGKVACRDDFFFIEFDETNIKQLSTCLFTTDRGGDIEGFLDVILYSLHHGDAERADCMELTGTDGVELIGRYSYKLD